MSKGLAFGLALIFYVGILSMDKIKTKSTLRDIKVLDKTSKVVGNAKNALGHVREQAEPQQKNNDNYLEYAGDKVKENAQTAIQKAGQFAQKQGKQVAQRIWDGRQAAASGKNGMAKQRAARKFAKTVKAPAKTVKSAGTAKTAIKTSQTVVKTAARSAKAAVRAAQRAVQAARMAAMAARFMVRAVIALVKAAIAAIKGLIALIAAGGWVVIVIILVICLVAFLLHSPLGIFFSGENKDAGVTPVSSVVQEVNEDFDTKIFAIEAENPDVDSVQIDYSGSADNTRIDNWMDVVAVFAVKTAMNQQNGMDVAAMDSTRVELLKSVFWNMNSVTWKVEVVEQTETVTVEDDDGIEREKTITTTKNILHITVTSTTAQQQAEAYGFTSNQKAVMNEMLSAEFRSMMFELLGMDSSIGLTPEQLQNLYNDLPSGQFGAQIVRLALSRLGDPYSQLYAGQGDYTDCSYLTQWCYGQVGISLPRTAADQAQYCVNNHKTISPNDLKPGDLVFFSLENNGRFMNISHVAVYAGNGYIVDASSSRGQVVYRPLFGGQVLYGRP